MKTALAALAAALITSAAGAAAAKDMEFRWATSDESCRECAWISAEGDILVNTPRAFAKFLAREAPAAGTVIRFDSPGGTVEPSLQLGQMIRDAGLVTNVGKTVFLSEDRQARAATHGKGSCASACAYAFLGGVQRSLETGSRLGVHRFYSGGSNGSDESAQYAIARLGYYMAEMGVSNDFLIMAAATPSSSMLWPDRAALESVGALTDVSAPAEALWQLALADSRLVLRSTQTQKNGSVTEFTLQCSAEQPDVFNLVARRPLARPAGADGAALGLALKRLTVHGQSGGERVDVSAVEVGEDAIDITAEVGRETIKRLAALRGEELWVDFEAPATLAGLVGGLSHRLPLTNLGEAARVLERNCAA